MPSRTWQTWSRRRSQNGPKLNHDMGRMDNLCNHCGAFIWKYENKSLCCANGQVTLPPIPPPPLFLQRLFSGTDAKCRTFKDSIRAYNSSLAFASLGVNEEFLPPVDSVEETKHTNLYPTEFPNSVNVAGLPPNRLALKEHTPVMLIRNLDPKSGLLNGTRLKNLHLGDRIIEAVILTGSKRGNRVLIPRITISP